MNRKISSPSLSSNNRKLCPVQTKEPEDDIHLSSDGAFSFIQLPQIKAYQFLTYYLSPIGKSF